MIAIARGGPLAASTVLRLNAISQMLSLVNARGGSVFAHQESTSTLNSDGSGGLVLPGGSIGRVANLAGGLGRGPQLRPSLPFNSAPWTANGAVTLNASGFVTTGVGGAFQTGIPNLQIGDAVLITILGVVTGANLEIRETVSGISMTGIIAPGSFSFSAVGRITDPSFGIYVLLDGPGLVTFTGFSVFQLPASFASAATQATALNKPTAGNSLAVPGLREMAFDTDDSLLIPTVAPVSVQAARWGVVAFRLPPSSVFSPVVVLGANGAGASSDYVFWEGPSLRIGFACKSDAGASEFLYDSRGAVSTPNTDQSLVWWFDGANNISIRCGGVTSVRAITPGAISAGSYAFRWQSANIATTQYIVARGSGVLTAVEAAVLERGALAVIPGVFV